MGSELAVNYQMQYDPDAHAMYIELPPFPHAHGCSKRTSDLGYGVFLDHDATGRVIGVEILLGRVASTEEPDR